MKARVDNDENSKNLGYTIVSHLIEMRKYYLKKNKKTMFDDTIFEDFSLDLAGKTLSAEKERQIIGELRKKRNKPFLFSYDPTNKKDGETNIKYIFRNTSGNIIKTSKKSKLFTDKNDDDIEDLDELTIEEDNEISDEQQNDVLESTN